MSVAVALSIEANWLHTQALMHSNLWQLDLRIKKTDLGFAHARADEWVFKELEAAGWWFDEGDHWNIGGFFPEWQLEKAVVDGRKADTAQRNRRLRLHNVGEHWMCTEQCKAKASPHFTEDDHTWCTDRCKGYVRDASPAASLAASRDASPGTVRLGPDRSSPQKPKEAVEEKEDAYAGARESTGTCSGCGRTSGFLVGGRCRRDECQRSTRPPQTHC